MAIRLSGMRVLALLSALALASAAPAVETVKRPVLKPRYSADQVFEKVLAAQEAQAWADARIEKEEASEGAKPQVSKGRLRVKPGGLARLEFTEPAAGLIVCDGKSLYMELPEVQQVMRYSAAKLREGGNFFLDLAPTIRHYAKVSLRRLVLPGKGFDPQAVTALELQPLKPEQAGFEKLRVWVDMDDWSILRVRLEYGGTRTTVSFSGRKAATLDQVAKGKKKDLEGALFQYKAPGDFEVFDLDL